MVDDRIGKFDRSLPLFLQRLGGAFPGGPASTVDSPDGTRSTESDGPERVGS
jgi:hypothetical protein